jgi:putative SOS response-associated peptidase YedK
VTVTFLFNTRSEDVIKSSFWKSKFAQSRCIIPASSFFEQQDTKKTPKPKYEVTVPERELLGIPGIWSPWKNPKTDQWKKTFLIFTSDPNNVMKPIHNRQPVVLKSRDFREWLSPCERPPLHLLRILPDEEVTLTLVPAKVEEPMMKSLFD